MFNSYIKIANRNLRFKKGQSYIILNVIGLASAIAAALLLFAVVQFESEFDTFHKNHKDIYRIVTKDTEPGGETFSSGVPYLLDDYIKLNLSQVKKITPIDAVYGSQITVPAGENTQMESKFKENEGVFFTGPEYFDVFDAQWLSGTPDVLASPDIVVLDRKMATRYFGNWQQAVGKHIRMDRTLTLKVAGVIEELPANSDFPMKIIISYNTLKRNAEKYGYDPNLGYINSSHQVFILLTKGVDPQQVDASLTGLSDKMYDNKNQTGKYHFLLPLKENHFDSRFSNFGDHVANRSTLRVLTLIGVLIIAMASINFVNISTAQGGRRSKEIGIRKVLGSNRRQLIIQLLLETAIVAFLSVILGAIISWILLPYLKNMANIHERLELLSWSSLLFLVVIFVVITFLSGAYPAFVLSGLKPIKALNKYSGSGIGGGTRLRKILVVVQFSILQILMIATVIIISQMNYIHTADLGYNKSSIFIVPCYSDSTNVQRLLTLKNKLLEDPGIESVSFATDPPSSDNNWASNFYFGHSKKDLGFNVFLKFTDADYFKTFDLHIVAGQPLAIGDTIREFVVNETFVRKLELKSNEEVIGKSIRLGTGRWYPIVGVVRDFKTNSLREDIKPMAIAVDRNAYSQINIKILPTGIKKSVAHITSIWQSFFPDYAFTGEFLDESVARFYRQESQLVALYKSFSLIAVLISCLGLYSLIAFMTLQRKKEIAVRKVLGADVKSILQLFLKELLMLVGISFLISVPLGYYGIHRWLENFPYRVEISAVEFFIVFLITLLIASLTVANKVLKAAVANPKESLQGE